MTRASRRWRLVAGLAAIGLVASACGGGGSKKSSASDATTTSTTADTGTSTTALGTTDSTAPTTTTQSGATPTTARSTTRATVSTAKKATTATTTAGGVTKAPTGGITNVTAAPSTAQPSDIQPGGTVTFLKVAEIASLDPTTMVNSGSHDGLPASAVYDTLVYTDPTNGTVVPQTAESLTSTDALVWTLKLRPNIKFSDGTPYDAAAVKFNWQRLQDPANHATRASQANLVQSMDVVDATTLRFTLKAKNSVFPVAMALIPFVGSPTAIQQQGADFGAHPIGAGPFLLKSWTRDSQMVFVRNPNYWNAPRPYLDGLVLRVITDEVQRINTFAAGQANMVFVGAAQNADKTIKDGTGVPHPMILNGGINIYFNTTALPFSDLRARQAFATAIDFTDYSKVVDNGLVEPIDSIFRHDSPFYDPTIKQSTFDKVKAQQLFDAYAKDNGPLNFTMIISPSPNYQLSAQYLQGVLNKYNNVKMNLQTVASATQIATCANHTKFDAACMTGNIFDDPEPTWTGLYTCSASPSPTGWCNTQFDKDVADNQATLDGRQRIADIKDAQKQFYTDLPALYVERRYSWIFSAANVQNFQFSNDGMVLIDRVWLKTR
jgi:peptide/nickel transport system substrate-binding protein